MNRALLIGINEYQQPQFNLNGCVNDVTAMADLLKDKFSFSDSDIRFLTNREATRNNIIENINALLSDIADSDRIILYFAGHGTQKNYNVDGENSGRDQAIVPYEISMGSLITDNELFDLIGPRVENSTAKFTAIYDCCHSGTMVRFVDFAEDGSVDTVLNRCIDVPMPKLALRAANMAPYNVLSACKDEQTAADLKVEGVSRGAFSFALQRLLRDSPNIRIADCEKMVLETIQRISTHIQEPQYYAVDPGTSLVVG